MIFFWTIKCPYRRHWIPAGSMFTYFCFGWLFRIIFTSVYLFNQKFNICIIIDSVLWNFCYLLNTNVLVSSKGSTVQKITKIFIFTYFFLQSKFAFCSKWMKTVKQQNSLSCFDVIPLNNADNFLLQDNVSLFY